MTECPDCKRKDEALRVAAKQLDEVRTGEDFESECWGVADRCRAALATPAECPENSPGCHCTDKRHQIERERDEWKAKAEKYRAALEKYADESNWAGGSMTRRHGWWAGEDEDGFTLAQEALE